MEFEAVTRFARTLRCYALAAITVCAVALFFATPSQAFATPEDFALLADTHLGQPYKPSYKETEHALNWAIKFDNLKAVCVAGDLTDRGASDSYDEWESLCSSILDGPVHIQALGDHDTGKNGEYLRHFPELTVARGYANFLKVNGGSTTSFTQFETANVITVGGVRANGYRIITKEMLEQLNSRLQVTAREGKMAIVVCHYPYDNSALNMRSKLMGILRSYPNVIYVSGHKHQYSSSKQCQVAKPDCTTTPFKRVGFSRDTKYSFRSIGVNACSAYRAGNGISYADSLTIKENGQITVQKWNLTKNLVEKKWVFEQAKSTVAVKSVPASKRYPRKNLLEYRITFSDGKAYGGVNSGETFLLKAGRTKKFSNIPAGVLVTVKQVSAPKGWSKAKSVRVEVGKKARTLTMKAKYKKPASSSSRRLRATSASGASI
ncbi:MAG: metallophosphoesterase [Eggerthellaceae bacterium]|nr:metallophosphoesterase [Eggerthellaceae bacterium]